MNIFVQELRQNRKSLLFWCLGMLFLVAASVGKTSGMTAQGGEAMTLMIGLMPKSMQALFGLGVVDFSKSIGIFAIVQLYIALIAAYHAVGLGASTFAREERDRTFEFLYVRGRPRGHILRSKLLADLVLMLILSAFTYLSGTGIVLLVEGQNIAAAFLPMIAGIGVLQLVFYSLGLLTSLLTRRMRLSSSISAGITMALFLLYMLTSVASPDSWLQALSPFSWFDGKRILTQGLSPLPSLIWCALAAAMAAVSFRLHGIRDLRT